MLLAMGAILALLLPHADTFAQNATGSGLIDPRDKPDDVIGSDFRTAVIGIINYFLGFLGLIAVAFVIYAGVLMVTSQGEDENTGKAKKILLYAAIGIIIILMSFAIVNVVIGVGDNVA